MSNDRRAFLDTLSEAKASRLEDRASVKRRILEQTTSLPAEAERVAPDLSQFPDLASYREAGGAATPDVINHFDSRQTQRLLDGQDRLSTALAARTESRDAGEVISDPARKFTGAGLNMAGGILDMAAPDPVPGEENILDRVVGRAKDVGIGTLGGLLDLTEGEPVDDPSDLRESRDAFRQSLRDVVTDHEDARAQARVADDAQRAVEGRPSLDEQRDQNPLNQAGDHLSGFGKYLGSEAVSPQQQLADQELGKAAEDGFLSAVGYAATNFVDFASSVGPDTAAFLVPAAAAGRVAGAGGRAAGLSDEAADALASTSGITAVGSTATIVNASGVATQIMDMDAGMLEQSPIYNELREEGLSQEQAQIEMATRGFSRTLGLSGLSNAATLGLASKFRANVLEDIAAGRKAAGRAGLIRGGAVAGAKEFLSEAAQEGGEAVAAGAGEVGAGIRPLEELYDDVPGAIGIGAMAGGSTGAVAGVGQQIGHNLEEGKKALDAASVRKEEQKEREETGDVSTFLDSNPETFNPPKALATLRKHVSKHEPTQQTVDSAKATTEAMRTQKTELEADLGITTPAEYQEEVARQEKNEATIKDKDKGKKLSKEAVDAVKTQGKLLKTLGAINTKLLEAESFVQEVTTRLNNPDVSATIKEADAAPSPASTKAAESVTTLAMNNPDALDLDEVDALVANEDNSLSSSQRDFLKQTSASRRSINALKGLEGVRKEVFEGGPGYRGLDEYESSFRAAMGRGDRKTAVAELLGLQRFAQSREAKRAAMAEAFDKVEGTDQATGIARDESNTWQQVTAAEGDRANAEGRGNVIRGGSGNLLNTLTRESETLAVAAEALTSHLALVDSPQASEPAPQADAAPSPAPADPKTSKAAPEKAAPEAPADPEPVQASPGELASADPVSTQDGTPGGNEVAEVFYTNDFGTDEIPSVGEHTVGAYTDTEGRIWEVKDSGQIHRVNPKGESLGLRGNAAADGGKGDSYSKKFSKWVEDEKVQLAGVRGKPEPVSEASDPAPAETPAPVEPVQASPEELAPADLYEDLEAREDDVSTQVPEDVPADVPTQSDADLEAEREAEADAQAEVLDDVEAEIEADAELEAEDAPEPTFEETIEDEAGLVSPYKDPKAQAPKKDWNAKDFKELNHLVQFYRQSEGKDDAGSLRPLVYVKDFLSWLRGENRNLSRFLKNPDLTDGQKQTLRRFETQAAAWLPKIAALLPPVGARQEQFFYEDPIYYFMDENGDIDENVKTAIAYGAFTFVAESSDLNWNDQKAINRLLGRRADTEIRPDEYKALLHAGQPRQGLEAQIGQRIVQALGFKALKHAPVEFQAKLEAMLGFYGLELLESENIVEVRELSSARLAALMTDTAGQTEDRADPVSIQPQELRRRSKGIQKEINRRTEGASKRNKVLLSRLDKWLKEGELDTFIAENQDLQSSTAAVNELMEFATKTTDYVRFPFTMEKNPATGRNRMVLGTEASTALTDFRSVVSHSQGVLGKLFGTEDRLKFPGLEPVPYTQSQVKGVQDVPAEMETILDEKNHMPNRVREDNWYVFGKLGSVVDRIAGIKPAGYKYHVSRQMGQEAKNDDLGRQLDNFTLFMEGLPYNEDGSLAEFYFEHEMWRPQRVGILGSLVNPLQSKIHRELVAPTDARRPVPTDVSTDAFTYFRLAIGQGLGIDIDKQSHEDSLAQLDAKVTDPVIERAVTLLQGALHNDATLSEAEQAAVAEAVEQGGEDFHSLTALVNLAHQRQVTQFPDTKIETDITIEVDGVANGPMLAMLGMGITDLSVLEAGGFFSQANGHENYNEWRPGRNDLYETFAGKMAHALSLLTDKRDLKKMEGIAEIMGDLIQNDGVSPATRDLVKKAVTPLIYGSSANNAVADMATKFIEGYLEQIEDLANNGGTQDQMNRLTDAIDKVAGRRQRTKSEYPTIDDALSQALTPSLEAAIRKGYTFTVGKALKDTLTSNFSTFIDRRNQMNVAVGVAFSVQSGLKEGLESKELDRLDGDQQIAKTNPGKDGKPGKPIHGLTAEQRGQVSERTAEGDLFLNTPMSRGIRESGIYLPKTRRVSQDDPALTLQPSVADKSSKNGVSRTTVRAMAEILASPGVAAGVLSTHALDSAATHRAFKGKAVLNVHDANIGAFDMSPVIAQDLNEAVFQSAMDYSAPMAIFRMLERTIEQAGELADAADVEVILESLELPTNPDPGAPPTRIEDVVRDTWRYAIKATQDKLRAMSEMGYVSQYAFQGGSYRVTDKDRAKALEMLENLPSTAVPPEQVMKAAARLDQIIEYVEGERPQREFDLTDPLDADPVSTPEEMAALDSVIAASIEAGLEAETEAAIAVRTELAAGRMSMEMAVRRYAPTAAGASVREDVRTQRDAQPRTSNVHGTLGAPQIVSDEELVTMFKEKGERTAKEMIAWLNRRLTQREGGRGRAFQKEFLRVLAKTVDPDLVLQYVTPDTPADGVYEEGLTKARGWYSNKFVPGGRIFIKSQDFVSAGLTEETLLHELTHAALATTVADAQADPNHAAREFVDELERLREKAADVIAADPELQAEFGSEFPVLKGAGSEAARNKGVQELISWGMTNVAFQRKVLNNSRLSIQSKTRKSELLSGMKRFIDTVTAILFQGSNKTKRELQYNGMRALIDNVSGLAWVQAKGDTRTKSRVEALAQNNADPLTMTNDQVLDALAAHQNGTLDPGFVGHLKHLLGTIARKVHGPFGAEHARYASDPALSRADRYAQALATGEATFASHTLFSHLTVNEQEAFVLEQVEVSIATALNNTATNVSTTAINAQLNRIFREAKATLTPAHFQQAFGVDQATAEAQHRFVFTAEQNGDGSTSVLSRFAALGLTSSKFRNLLDFNTYKSPKRLKDLGWKERLATVFNTAMDFLLGRSQEANDQDPARQQISALVDQLVRIETKRQTMLERREGQLTSKIEDELASLTQSARKKIEEGGRSVVFRSSRNGIVRALGSTTSAIAGERVSVLLDSAQRVRDKAMNERQGAVMGAVTEARSLPNWLADVLLLANRNEQRRKGIKDGTINSLNGKPGSKDDTGEFARKLDQSEKEDITSILRADTSLLLDSMTMGELETLLRDPAALEKAIQALEAQVGALPHHTEYLRQAKDTAYHMATEHNRSPHLHKNAYTMARRFGEGGGRVSAKDAKAAQAILDPLISLYALRHTNAETRSRVGDIMRTEAGRTDRRNGMEFTLRLAEQLKQQSKERLFEDSEALMIKGYMPELYSDDVEVLVAGPLEGERLIRQGYVAVSQLINDPSDPDQSRKSLYALRGMGLQSYNTGAVSNTGLAARGEHSKAHHGLVHAASGTPHQKNSVVHARIQNKKAAQMAKRSLAPTYDPAQEPAQNHMVPVFNPQGQVVNYRYMMSKEVKDNVMGRDNSFDAVLGAFAANNFDKQSSVEQNEKVIGHLLEQYQEDAAERPESYLEVGPDSSDPELREYWRMLPESAKAMVPKIWGQNRMMVRTDHIDQVFGFRKLSMANAWRKMSKKEAESLRKAGIRPEDPVRSTAEHLFTSAVEAFLGDKSALRVRQAEDAWQEIVRETKDILVVKTGATLFFNIMSNVFLNYWMGVGFIDQLKSGRAAMKGVVEYRQDNAELERLRSMRDSNYVGSTKDLDLEIVLLENQLALNPARELIEAGLLPTIVEDVSLDDDQYSYKARLGNAAEKYTSKLHPNVRKAARTLYMAHDTPLYKAMAQGTQLSDFVARYTLFQHQTTRRMNPLSREDAIRSASDVFVNYDVPSGRTIQYLNDMGLLFFTKYYIRIQRVILSQWKESPGRGLAIMAAGSYFDGIQTILDSTASIGNPLNAGALEFAGAVDEPMTMKALEEMMEMVVGD